MSYKKRRECIHRSKTSRSNKSKLTGIYIYKYEDIKRKFPCIMLWICRGEEAFHHTFLLYLPLYFPSELHHSISKVCSLQRHNPILLMQKLPQSSRACFLILYSCGSEELYQRILFWDRSKFTWYLGRVLGKIKKSSRPFFSRKKSLPPYLLRKKS